MKLGAVFWCLVVEYCTFQKIDHEIFSMISIAFSSRTFMPTNMLVNVQVCQKYDFRYRFVGNISEAYSPTSFGTVDLAITFCCHVGCKPTYFVLFGDIFPVCIQFSLCSQIFMAQIPCLHTLYYTPFSGIWTTSRILTIILSPQFVHASVLCMYWLHT